RAVPGFQRLRGREAVRAESDDRAVLTRANSVAGPEGVERVRPDCSNDAVPGARLPRADPRRTDRGRVRTQGARRLHAQGRCRLQSARRRADRRWWTDRVQPDRNLREARAVRLRGQLPFLPRIPALRSPRDLAALGSDPFRTVMTAESAAHFPRASFVASLRSRDR